MHLPSTLRSLHVRFVVSVCVTVALAIVPQPVAAGLVVGTFDATRAGIAEIDTSAYSQDAVATANAMYPGLSFVTFPTITAQALQGVNLLVIGTDFDTVNPITPLSPSEQTSLLNFVEAGGSALLIADGWGAHVPAAQSMVGTFGLTIQDDGYTGPLNGTPINIPNPITNGPYGSVSQIDLLGAGILTDLGTYATPLANEDVTGKPVLAVVPAGALTPTSGRVVIYTDSQMFINDSLGGNFNEQTALFQNTLHYLVAVPEPSSIVTAAVGAALAALAYRRRIRRASRAMLVALVVPRNSAVVRSHVTNF